MHFERVAHQRLGLVIAAELDQHGRLVVGDRGGGGAVAFAALTIDREGFAEMRFGVCRLPSRKSQHAERIERVGDEHVVIAERATLDLQRFLQRGLSFIEAALRAQRSAEQLQAFGNGWMLITEKLASDRQRLAQGNLGLLRAALLRQGEAIVVEHLRDVRVFIAINRPCIGDRLLQRVRRFIELSAPGQHQRREVERQCRPGIGDGRVEVVLLLAQQAALGQCSRQQSRLRLHRECSGQRLLGLVEFAALAFRHRKFNLRADRAVGTGNEPAQLDSRITQQLLSLRILAKLPVQRP